MNRTGEEIATDLDGIAKEIDSTNYTYVHMRQEKMRVLTARRDVLLKEHNAALARQAYVTIPVYGWSCFHCGERFYETDKAREHFGNTPLSPPACSTGRTQEARDNYRMLMEKQLTNLSNTPNPFNGQPVRDANGFTAADRAIMRDDPT